MLDLLKPHHLAKFLLRIDDALDLFAEHAVGGIVGLLLNGFFASGSIVAMDSVTVGVRGGWVDHNWKQLYIQFTYVVATCAYTFVMTALVAKTVDLIPGLQLRSTPEGEMLGMDEVEASSRMSSILYYLDNCLPTDRRIRDRLYRAASRRCRLLNIRLLKTCQWIPTRRR